MGTKPRASVLPSECLMGSDLRPSLSLLPQPAHALPATSPFPSLPFLLCQFLGKANNSQRQ